MTSRERQSEWERKNIYKKTLFTKLMTSTSYKINYIFFLLTLLMFLLAWMYLLVDFSCFLTIYTQKFFCKKLILKKFILKISLLKSYSTNTKHHRIFTSTVTKTRTTMKGNEQCLKMTFRKKICCMCRKKREKRNA
jgi:hypothetical protein